MCAARSSSSSSFTRMATSSETPPRVPRPSTAAYTLIMDCALKCEMVADVRWSWNARGCPGLRHSAGWVPVHRNILQRLEGTTRYLRRLHGNVVLTPFFRVEPEGWCSLEAELSDTSTFCATSLAC